MRAKERLSIAVPEVAENDWDSDETAFLPENTRGVTLATAEAEELVRDLKYCWKTWCVRGIKMTKLTFWRVVLPLFLSR